MDDAFVTLAKLRPAFIKEILVLIAEGFTNPEIANKLFVSPTTVDSHRKNLLAKLNVKNTASLIKFAMDHQLI